MANRRALTEEPSIGLGCPRFETDSLNGHEKVVEKNGHYH